jgi:hypothetical protein
MSKDKIIPFYATLWFGSFRLDNFEIPLGQEFRPIYIVHPLGLTTMATNFEGKLETPENIEPLKKMTFEYKHQLGPRHLEYIFAEET